MLEYSQILPKKYIVVDGEPYEVLAAHVSRKSMAKASNQTKLRNLKKGNVIEKAFHQSDSVEEADIGKKTITYLYEKRGEYWFCEEGNPKNRFCLSAAVLGDTIPYLKQNTSITALTFDDEVIGITLPVKMDFKVVEAPPAVRGNTVQGGSKQVTTETGVTVSVPLFINQGDVIRINTETGEYVERVTKS